MKSRSEFEPPRRHRRALKDDPGPVEPPSDNATVNAALTRCVAGDRTACDGFISHLSRFRRWLLERLGGRRLWHDTQDAIQDVLLKLYRAALEGLLPEPQADWCCFLVLKVRDQRRENKRRQRRTRRRRTPASRGKPVLEYVPPRTLEEVPWDHVSPDQIATARDVFRYVAKRLTPRERQVVLAHLSALTAREIGEVLGMLPGTARVLWHRAIRKLKRDLRGAA